MTQHQPSSRSPAPFDYRDGLLHAENVALTTIAKAAGTPVYVYAANRIRANYTTLADALLPLGDTRICFAVKANGNQAILTLLAQLGAGADIVSGGELERALAAGIPANKIVFSGVGKTEAELAAALEAGIHQINIESLPEMEQLSHVAQRLNKIAPIALRINPDVAADTHHKIATGKKGNKFGIDHEQVGDAAALARALPNLELVGLAVHIGSQLFDIDTFRKAYRATGDIFLHLKEQGHETLSRIDLGGGMGVRYEDGKEPFDPAAYAAMVRETLGPLGCSYCFEPGRFIVADAGVLLTQVIRVKQGIEHRFVVVDGAMNDLIRPTLYEAWHTVRPVQQAKTDAATKCDVVGPICETGDIFAKDRALPPLAAGDLLAIDHAGAYGAVMAGTYNTRPLIGEVLVDGDRFEIIRNPIDPKTQIAWDHVPAWISP